MRLGRRIALAATVALLAVSLCGCWDYRDTNDMSIVTGVGIDLAPDGQYRMSFEIIDMDIPVKDSGAKATVVTSDGQTLYEAIRGATSYIRNRLFFNNVSLLVISHELAEQEGINDILDWFLRDSGCRETLNVAISYEKTAQEIFTLANQDNNILSYNASQVLNQNHSLNISTSDVELYQAYNTLHRDGIELTLPVFRFVEQEEEEIKRIDGVAVFQEDKLKGFLTEQQTRDYLFVTDDIHGGIFSFDYQDGKIALEIKDSNTNVGYRMEHGSPVFSLEIDITSALGESQTQLSVFSQSEIEQIAQAAQEALSQSIQQTISTIQKEYRTDIFGFGYLIYRSDPDAWETLEGDWDAVFADLRVEVETAFTIQNTGLLK
ncbi:MAG: Ger(x)C family spore germination protein [Clostridiales bacterium]|nr:Ger(x)C family spore germination protein [Clostridiales bacterium]